MKRRDPLITVEEVAEMLELAVYTVEHHISTGKIKPAYVLGEDRRRLFKTSDVKKYMAYYMNEKDFTLDEIAEMVDKSRDVVHWHFCRKRNVRPSGRRGKKFVFSMSSIRMVARSQGWTLTTPELESPLQLQVPRVPEALEPVSAE